MTVPWAFFGWRLARKCVFPAAFLLFTVPVSSFLDFFTIHLRMLAGNTAIAVLNGVGLDVVQKGTAIISQGSHPFNIDVAEPCSGLRSFFALTALTAAYAWFSQPTWTRRAVLFAFSAPIAIAGNVVRVISICVVAAFATPDFALGFYHDYSGYVVFAIAISAMVATGEIVARISEHVASRRACAPSAGAPSPEPAEDVRPSVAGTGFWRPAVSAVVLSAVFAFQAQTPAGKIMSAPEVSLPDSVPGFSSDGVRYCMNEQCGGFFALSRLENGDGPCPACGSPLAGISIGERNILPPDTVIMRRLYRAPSGASFLVSAVVGGETKNSIHRPELCLPAQGYLLQHPCDFTVAGRPFHALDTVPPGGLPGTMAYTFFNQAGVRTASHVSRIITDVWDRSVHNRIDRWVMLTVHGDAPGGFTCSAPGDRLVLELLLRRITENMP